MCVSEVYTDRIKWTHAASTIRNVCCVFIDTFTAGEPIDGFFVVPGTFVVFVTIIVLVTVHTIAFYFFVKIVLGFLTAAGIDSVTKIELVA